MSWSIRRAVLVLTAVSVLGSIAFLEHAAARLIGRRRPAPPGGAVDMPAPGSSRELAFGNITLPKDDKQSAKIDAALDYIQVQDWKKACEAIQKILSKKDLSFGRVRTRTPDGKETETWINVRIKAEQLLANLPQKGKEGYQDDYGPTGEKLLREALSEGDLQKMGGVFAQYFYTDAGAKATEWLALHFLDRGAVGASTNYFYKLLTREGADKLSPLTLTKAAYAFHLAGEPEKEKLAYKLLDDANVREVAIGGENKSLDELKGFIAQSSHSAVSDSSSSCAVVRNDPARTGISRGGAPFIQDAWAFEMVYGDGVKDAKPKIDEAMREIAKKKQPLLTTFFPTTASASRNGVREPLVIVRSYGGIHAVDVKTGSVKWQQPCAWSLQGMLSGEDESSPTGNNQQTDKSRALNDWFGLYVTHGQRPELVFENSLIGSASSDSTMVYVIDALCLPPPHATNINNPWGGMQQGNQYPGLQPAIRSNRLQAYELAKDGKLAWEINGADEKTGPLKDCFFLGPPLPLNGKIYVLTEKQQELKVLCIDPVARRNDPRYFEPRIVSTTTLGTTKTKIENDITRRTSASFLAYGEGVLVIPTNAGAIFGIDLLSGNLLWAYPYFEGGTSTTPVNQPGMPPGWVRLPDGRMVPAIPENSGSWKVSPPIIVDGKVVFTAPDARSLHCFSLKDGSRLWTRPKGADDLYLGGVVRGKVIVVGKKRTRGLNLNNGEVVWDLETGLPSGQGVATESYYYLPLSQATRTHKPEICAIDVEHGLIHAHTIVRPTADKTPDNPGNLIFFEGQVLSQTPTRLVCYPQLKYKMAEMDAAISRNPNDPKGLTYRGELRLDQGDLKGAIQDLSRALKNDPPQDLRETARAKLYDTMTELFQRDFNSAEEYLKEYEELCKVDTAGLQGTQLEKMKAEERKRRSRFLWLLAKGREGQGKLLEAFEKYQEFSQAAGKDGELTPVLDDPTVQAAPEVWARSRVERMMATATPEQRKPLEDLINNKWQTLRGTNDTEKLRGFVDMFGSSFKAGKEARLFLAERLLREGSPEALLKAEQQLSLLRGPNEQPETAARAVETLARLYLKKRLIEDAAYCYRLLGRRYANVNVTGGKTGGQLYDDMMSDKRLQGAIDEAEPFTGGALKFDRSSSDGVNPNHNYYTFTQVGEPLPYFQRYEVRYNLLGGKVELVDRKNGHAEEVKQFTMSPATRQSMQMLVQRYSQSEKLRFPYQTLGHLIILPLLNMVYAIDPLSGQVVWEKNLYGGEGSQNNNVNWQASITMDPRDGSLQVTHNGGWIQRIGQAGPLGARILCVQMPDALVGLDPLTSRELWRRTSVSARYQIRGDDEYIYVIGQGDNNSIESTRVLRVADGTTVRVRGSDGTLTEAPGFAHAYEKRLSMFEHYLLVSDTDVRGQPQLRLYNILTGKDEWKEAFPTGSKVLQSQDRDLTGVVEPDGEVRILDVRTGKRIFGGKGLPSVQSKIAEDDLRTAKSVQLLADGRFFFIVCSQPTNGSGPFNNVMPFADFRMLPINGPAYVYVRKTGELRHNTGEYTQRQMIMLNHFRELPFIILTARYNEANKVGFGNVNVGSIKFIDKNTGKLLVDPNQESGQVLSLRVNLRHSRLELVTTQHRITAFVDYGDAAPVKKP